MKKDILSKMSYIKYVSLVKYQIVEVLFWGGVGPFSGCWNLTFIFAVIRDRAFIFCRNLGFTPIRSWELNICFSGSRKECFFFRNSGWHPLQPPLFSYLVVPKPVCELVKYDNFNNFMMLLWPHNWQFFSKISKLPHCIYLLIKKNIIFDWIEEFYCFLEFQEPENSFCQTSFFLEL